MKANGMRLGQEGERTDEGAWLFITFRDGKYITWSEADDGEIRELLSIAPKQKLPRIQVKRWDIPQRLAYVKKGLVKYRKIGNEIPQEAQEKVIRESAAEVILVDWELIAMKDLAWHKPPAEMETPRSAAVVPFGHGNVEWGVLVEELKRRHYDGTLVFHCEYGMMTAESVLNQAAIDVRAFRALWDKAE